jgi:hypothetical protein
MLKNLASRKEVYVNTCRYVNEGIEEGSVFVTRNKSEGEYWIPSEHQIPESKQFEIINTETAQASWVY